tara:strand:- start:697 stop:1014 length:318 start_codon:yes stop_codon:yes gene_type:complete
MDLSSGQICPQPSTAQRIWRDWESFSSRYSQRWPQFHLPSQPLQRRQSPQKSRKAKPTTACAMFVSESDDPKKAQALNHRDLVVDEKRRRDFKYMTAAESTEATS